MPSVYGNQKLKETNTNRLGEQVEQASKAITPRYVERCLDHVLKYYPACIAMQDLTQFQPVME